MAESLAKAFMNIQRNNAERTKKMGNLVNFENQDEIGILKINRPEALNALNRSVIDEIDQFLDQIVCDCSLKVLMITGDGNFAAGADIKDMVECTPEQAASFSFSDTFDRIAALKIPTIAVIEGYALGGGLELALACDFRIASRTAKMGLPEITLGIMPGAGGNIRLPRLIGESMALEMILFGNIISAEKAEKIGLINEMTEKENLLDVAMAWSNKLAQRPGLAAKTAKETVKTGMESSLEDGIGLEKSNWASLFVTADQKEGMRAFIEKRKPVFQNK